MWRWQDIRPLLLEAGELISAAEAERRVLVLENPGLAHSHRITSTLYAGIQLVLPGEVAPCHRHTQSALRFVLEGSGAFTAVDGERIHMERWDLVLTPAMRWHDHGNETEKPIVWLDGLDIPLVSALDAGFAERLPGHGAHPQTRLAGDNRARYGANLRPVREAAGRSGLFTYPFSQWRESLRIASLGSDPDLHDGYRFEFTDPVTAGSVLPTISAFVQLIPSGLELQTQRSTDSIVIVVVEGEGTLRVNDTILPLVEGAIAVVPSWATRSMRSTRDLVIFSFSDKAVQTRLDLWREVLL
jgi:gentisate 1,2-dioxygenase